MTQQQALGFVGLGVMGGPMCANLAGRSGRPVIAFDRSSEALATAAGHGAVAAGSVAEVAAGADIVFLSLPSIVEVESVAERILAAPGRPRIVVDMSTSDVTRTRQLAQRLDTEGVALVDAPVARLRQAARDGTLLITVGASERQFAELEPLLSCMGSDIVHAGDVGNGQVVKILNNMVVFQNVRALAEALAVGRAAGVDGKLLLETLSLGSADSFALRKTALPTMVPDEFPERTFPTVYAIKDLRLALTLAAETGVPAQAAEQTMGLLERTRDAGFAEQYYPAMIRLIEGRA